MLTKYAAVEEILEIKSSSERMTFAYDEPEGSGFNKFAALQDGVREDDGFLYVRCRAISSRVNKNNDGWPSDELANAYSTFEGRPIFVDHNNDDPKRTRGVIIESSLHNEDAEKIAAHDPYYSSAPDNHKPPTWIELLLEVDGEAFPKLAKDIKEGNIDAVSMGANIEKSICSVCANEAATPGEYCNHIKQKGMTFEITSADGEKVKKKAYEDCYGVNFFEISFVFDPADPTADVLSKSASASQMKTEDEVQELATKAGVDFSEMAQHLTARGEYIDKTAKTGIPKIDTDEKTLAELASTGQPLGMDRVASLTKTALPVDQFIKPINQKGPSSPDRNYVPQHDMVTAPQEVNTLRDENTCPICRSAAMEAGQDGIMACPVCGHIQEPEPFDNPDLSMAKDLDLRQNVTDDLTPEGEPSAPESNPLDSVEFSAPNQMAAARKADITNEGISEMFTTKLRTNSKEEADKVLPVVKTARIEAKLGAHGVHRGVYEAARTAGLKVKVSYPALERDDSTVEVPGPNGIFNLFFAEESASKLNVPMSEVPIVIEADNAEDAEKFVEILANSPRARKAVAADEKKALLPEDAKPSDEPKNENVIVDPQEVVESKTAVVVEDGKVELDGKKYNLVAVEDESSDEPKDEAKVEGEEKEEEPKADEAPFEDPQKDEDKADEAEAKADESEDKEAKLLTAFRLADMAVELGLVEQPNKMAFIAELEEESMEALKGRQSVMETVKAAGFGKRTANKVGGVRRVPRLAHTMPTPLSNTGGTLDIPDEALYL